MAKDQVRLILTNLGGCGEGGSGGVAARRRRKEDMTLIDRAQAHACPTARQPPRAVDVLAREHGAAHKAVQS